jgi:catechol 2,3-dioxygenase-like lactoylglutathione lyase family enzyme
MKTERFSVSLGGAWRPMGREPPMRTDSAARRSGALSARWCPGRLVAHGSRHCQDHGVLRLGMVVLGVADMRRAVDFWSQALGYRLREGGPGGHWAVLTPASGSSAELALQVSTTPVQQQPRVRLDLATDDAAQQAQEVERLISLGAERVDWGPVSRRPRLCCPCRPGGQPLLRGRHLPRARLTSADAARQPHQGRSTARERAPQAHLPSSGAPGHTGATSGPRTTRQVVTALHARDPQPVKRNVVHTIASQGTVLRRAARTG